MRRVDVVVSAAARELAELGGVLFTSGRQRDSVRFLRTVRLVEVALERVDGERGTEVTGELLAEALCDRARVLQALLDAHCTVVAMAVAPVMHDRLEMAAQVLSAVVAGDDAGVALLVGHLSRPRQVRLFVDLVQMTVLAPGADAL